MSAPVRVHVDGPQPYDVVIGADLLDELPTLVGPRAERVLLVHPGAVGGTAGRAAALLTAAGYQVTRAEVPDGEAAKTYDVAARLWSTLGSDGFTRSDVVVAIGGGATTDVGGFVAATWLRGVRVVHVPTTVLGMVDAAIGGKTAIDTAEGKNLVGAFHEPTGVLCDLRLLRGLPRPEIASGLAEAVKTGFIADPTILDLIESDPLAAADPDGRVLPEVVERSVRVKARVVVADLRETGGREILNYGHTLGHAIEKVEHFGWRHGEAVSVGMIFAAELAAALGRLHRDIVSRHRDVLAALDLPTSYRRGRWPDLLDAMRVDKKSRGSTLRFVVLDGLAAPAVVEGPDERLLADVYGTVSS